MLRTFLSVSLALILAGGSVQARPHGGGGFHGGAHFGGFHSGGSFGGFHGSFHSPAFHPSARVNPGTHRFPVQSFRRDRFREWPAYGYTGPVSPSYSSSWYGSGGDSDEPGQSYPDQIDNNVSPVQQNGPAAIIMTLPADATLWAMGQKTSSTGSIREFTSPPLEAGGRYTYNFRASWKENGHTVTQTQKVIVTPGAHLEVHFPVQENSQTPQIR